MGRGAGKKNIIPIMNILKIKNIKKKSVRSWQSYKFFNLSSTGKTAILINENFH